MSVPGSPRIYRPTKVVEIELTKPIPDLTGLENYEAVKILVRFHSTPIGYTTCPLTSGCCTAQSILSAVLEPHSWRIICHQLRSALATPQSCAGLAPENLADVPPARFQGPFPSMAVIVCTRNRTDDLRQCLDSLKRLDYPSLELLVVDNAPDNDATAQLVRTHYPEARYVHEPTPGLSHARNRGIAEATADLIAFTDDDVVVDRDWAMAIARLFAESPEVMAVTGLVVPLELETEPQALFEIQGGFGRGFERKWYQIEPGNAGRSLLHHGAGHFGTGANMAFRKLAFDLVGLFDPGLGAGTVTCGGDDLDMFFRILQEGHLLVYEPAALVRHRHRRDYAGLRKQIEGNGLGLSAYHVRNSLAYPSERRAFSRLWRRWLWQRHLKPLLKSFTHPRLYPRDLILTELRGYLVGLKRYKTQYNPAAKGSTHVPERAEDRPDPEQLSTWRRHSAQFRGMASTNQAGKLLGTLGTVRINEPIAIREVNLNSPLHSLTGLEGYSNVRIVVSWNGSPLGYLDIGHCGQMVSVDRLRQAIADRFALAFIEPLPTANASFTWAKAMASLGRHFKWAQQDADSRPSSWLIDLARPLPSLSDVHNLSHVRVVVSRDGAPIGEVQIANHRLAISGTRLRDVLVDGLGLQLLNVPAHNSKDLLWSSTVTALIHRYQQHLNHHTIANPALPPHISVSVVIATRDRPDDLRTCLRAVCGQHTSRRVEVIVVDNHPASQLTPAVVNEFSGIMLIQEHRQGLSYARNTGISASSGEIVIATDDDVSMSSDWLEKLVAPFDRDDVMIVTGNVLPVELETVSQQRFEQYGGLGRGFERFERSREWFDSFTKLTVPTWRLGATANAAFRATLFHHPAIGMLDEALGAGMPSGCSEDTDLFYRVLKQGYTVLYEPTAYVWHNHRRTPQALRKQLYNYSKGGVANQLVILFRDKDLRALYRILVELPKVHWWRIKQRLLGKSDYPLWLLTIEILGNLMGPLALWQSRRRVARLGRSAPYKPVRERV